MADKIFYEDIVSEVKKDFASRREMRRPYELTWQLNMNFLMGNQYCNVNGRGEIEQDEKYFFWQEREAYNHIAPIIETRIAKLDKVRPKMTVVPFSDSQQDAKATELSQKILSCVAESTNLSKKISQATTWSETCGTVFYKITWDKNKGKKLGTANDRQVCEGDVDVAVCPPFEIYPDSNVCAGIDDCQSIIHAKAYSVQDVKNLWGVDVQGEEVQIFALDGAVALGGLGYDSTVPNVIAQKKQNTVIVIEKYIRPDNDNPNGRLLIVAGDKLLHDGPLPYINRENNERGFPFVRQVSQNTAGCFWGMSIIDRLIPIQRSYNAVKNRKHEFLNRISMGVLTVEDGSVDVDNLQEEGLSPGKVLIYRQGSEPPQIMDSGSVPMEFTYEEERLINEFMVISGTSELSRNSATPTNVTSGVALQLLIEQDDSRLTATADEIRFATKEIAQMILRLFRQFAFAPRYARVISKDNKIDVFTFSASDVVSDKVVVDTQNENDDTTSQKRSMMFELLARGVLYDKDGKLDEKTKSQILSLAGFATWQTDASLSSLHRKKAVAENVKMADSDQIVLDVDDHQLHVDEHVRYLLDDEGQHIKPQHFDRVLGHIAQHKQKMEVKVERT